MPKMVVVFYAERNVAPFLDCTVPPREIRRAAEHKRRFATEPEAHTYREER